MIALDLDGTLLTSKKTILPASLEALARAREAGYQVIVVTGRHHVAIHPFYQALALDTPAICCNGTYLYDYHAKKVLAADPMPVEQAVSLTAMLAKQQIHGLAYVDDAMLYEHPTGHVIRTRNWAQALPEDQRPVFAQVDSLAQAVREVNAVWKFALTDDDIPRLQRFAQQVGETLGLECEWSWHDQADCKSADTSFTGRSSLKPVALAKSAFNTLSDTGLGCTSIFVFTFLGMGSKKYFFPVITSTLAEVL